MDLTTVMPKLFQPQSIAVIEAASNREWQVSGIIDRFGTQNLYLVSSKEEAVCGVKCFHDISELPDGIDHAIIAVNRSKLQGLIEECIRKKFATLHIFTAGGAEFDEEGFTIEQQVYALIKESSLRAIGPNCMGVYSPGGKITYNPYFSEKKGRVAFVSHSGDLTTQFILRSNGNGVYFSMAASIGNSIDLKIADFIEFFNSDTSTDLIIVYFEGFSPFDSQDGRKFWRALKENKKPLLLLKGGATPAGKRAAASHTGSIASEDAVWEAVYKQTLAQKVVTFEDLVYSAMAFNFCKNFYPRLKSSLLIGWSGGQLVLSTDELLRQGIDLPEIAPETQRKMKAMISIGSVKNPLDLPWIVRREKYPEICKLAIQEKYIGGVFLETAAWERQEEQFYGYLGNLTKIFEYCKEYGKPFLVSLPESPFYVQRENFKNLLIERGIPVFPNLQSAAMAFLNMYNYQQQSLRFRDLS